MGRSSQTNWRMCPKRKDLVPSFSSLPENAVFFNTAEGDRRESKLNVLKQRPDLTVAAGCHLSRTIT